MNNAITIFFLFVSNLLVGQIINLDSTFNSTGLVSTDFGGLIDDRAFSIALQTDGKIVAAGRSHNGLDYDFAIARYNPNGILDNSFGTNGLVTIDFGGYTDRAQSVAIQQDGKIIIVGEGSISSPITDFAIARLNVDGSLDTSFNHTGLLISDITGTNERAFSVVIQNDGKILVAGQSYNGSDGDFALARYNSNGDLDTTFNSNGIVTSNINGVADIGNSVKLQTDNKIVLCGQASGVFGCIRYKTNGSIDSTFGQNGIILSPPSYGAFDFDIQTDGKLVLVGDGQGTPTSDIALYRFDGNGEVDSTFDYDGHVQTDLINTL
ncbi:MAG: hypothetical protein HRT57_06870, partial [Crocinitomicaceae bacterium]|nr:hypothetical protein [Crocinitomicaceae bacterium]